MLGLNVLIETHNMWTDYFVELSYIHEYNLYNLIYISQKITLRGHNWVHFVHRPQCTVTLNSDFSILITWNCFQLE